MCQTDSLDFYLAEEFIVALTDILALFFGTIIFPNGLVCIAWIVIQAIEILGHCNASHVLGGNLLTLVVLNVSYEICDVGVKISARLHGIHQFEAANLTTDLHLLHIFLFAIAIPLC